uniref:C3H1-type domain-containing protein n=1 Tax=Schistocephalus solidus TaxID=70667 RepID=A0A0V0J272_SCHSO
MSTVPGQLANLMAGYLLRRLTSLTETVSSYLGPPPASLEQSPQQDQTETGSCQTNSVEGNAGNGAKEKAFVGKTGSQMTTCREGDSEASRVNGSPRGLVIKDPSEQAIQRDKQMLVSETGRAGCSFCRLTGPRSPPGESLHNGQIAGGRAGEPRPRQEVTDWCRWPVCAVFRWGGQCPLGEYQCPDAHVGPEYLSQIDSNGLVRVCFESLGLGNVRKASH